MTSILLLITIALSGLNLSVVCQTPHFSSCDALIVALALGGTLSVSLYHLLVLLKPCAGLPAGLHLAHVAASVTVARLHDNVSQRIRAQVAATIPRRLDNPTVTDEDVTAVHTAVPTRRGR